MTEIFKPFPLEEYNDRFTVSNQGKIWSNRLKNYLKTERTDYDWFIIGKTATNPKMRRLRVDIMVAQAFYGPSDLYLEHIDDDMYNNHADNLRWIEITEYLANKYQGQWEEIGEMPEYYVSTTGQIWSAKSNNLISQQIIGECYCVRIGYPKSIIRNVHRIVAEAFLDNPRNLPNVAHNDKNNLNNNVENLVWVSVGEHTVRTQEKRTSEVRKPPTEYAVLVGMSDYYITPCGEVYSMKTRKYLLKQLHQTGYYRVNCAGVHYYMHRLVAEAYLPPLSEEEKAIKTQVNHKDLDRTNNTPDNLEWVSPSENSIHSAVASERNSHFRKKVARLDLQDNILEVYDGIKIAARELGLDSAAIVAVCKGRKKTLKGYKWKYVTNDDDTNNNDTEENTEDA